MKKTDQDKVKKYIEIHQLIEHHSQPGAYISDLYRCPEQVNVDEAIYAGGKRAVTNAIYYMVIEKGITKFNNLKSPKYWQYCDGSPQAVCLIDEKNNTLEEIILGDPLIHEELGKKLGKKIIQLIPILPHQWIGSRLIDQESFSLVTCTVTPGFDMRDFKVMEVEDAKKMFPNLSKQIVDFFNHTYATNK